MHPLLPLPLPHLLLSPPWQLLPLLFIGRLLHLPNLQLLMLLFLPSILELDAQPSDNPLLYPHSLITLKLPLPPLNPQSRFIPCAVSVWHFFFNLLFLTKI